MCPERSVTYVSGPDLYSVVPAGESNRRAVLKSRNLLILLNARDAKTPRNVFCGYVAVTRRLFYSAQPLGDSNGKYATVCWFDWILAVETSTLKHHHRCTPAPEPIDRKFQSIAEPSKLAESGERIIDGEIACVDAEGRSSFKELLFKNMKMLGPLDVECVNLLHAGVAEQERRIVGS
jgi:hypothetical protein